MPHTTNSTARMQAAGKKACEAQARTRRIAEAISEELDEVTQPGAPNVEIHDENSLVAVIEVALAANAK